MGTIGWARAVGWPAPLVLLAIGLLAAACNSGSGTAAPTITSRGAGATISLSALVTSTTGHGGQRAAAGTSPYYEVKTGTVSGLGTVLVNGQGLTLYMFVPDHQRGRSTCYNACASSWPPLRLPTGVTIPVAAGKAEASLLGTTTRKDGGLEVTYKGWPLYLWVGDGAPGQATGQGINGSGGYWYVLSPKGGVIKAKAK
jgi:predicted lipoprotein with Yx(FWY)xxD motif